MEAKYLAEVIVHPKHHPLTFGEQDPNLRTPIVLQRPNPLLAERGGSIREQKHLRTLAAQCTRVQNCDVLGLGCRRVRFFYEQDVLGSLDKWM